MFLEICFLQPLLTILERKNAGFGHPKAREKTFMIQNYTNRCHTRTQVCMQGSLENLQTDCWCVWV